jgi:hypothetical protein
MTIFFDLMLHNYNKNDILLDCNKKDKKNTLIATTTAHTGSIIALHIDQDHCLLKLLAIPCSQPNLGNKYIYLLLSPIIKL